MLVSAFITQLRRFARDLKLNAKETFDGDGSTSAFRLRNYPVIESSYTVKVGGTETTAFTVDTDTGVFTFTSPPVAGTDNVTISYKYAKLSDSEWLEIFNSVIAELGDKIWTDTSDTTTLTTVANQSEYDLDDISTEIFKVIGVWYRSSSSVDWTSISADTNIKYLREQNKLVLRPYLQVSGYEMKVRYLERFSEYDATTDTITHPDKYLKPIQYFCLAQFMDRMQARLIESLGANVKQDSYQPLGNLTSVRNNYERLAEKALIRVKPRMPAYSFHNVMFGKID